MCLKLRMQWVQRVRENFIRRSVRIVQFLGFILRFFRKVFFLFVLKVLFLRVMFSLWVVLSDVMISGMRIEVIFCILVKRFFLLSFSFLFFWVFIMVLVSQYRVGMQWRVMVRVRLSLQGRLSLMKFRMSFFCVVVMRRRNVMSVKLRSFVEYVILMKNFLRCGL